MTIDERPGSHGPEGPAPRLGAGRRTIALVALLVPVSVLTLLAIGPRPWLPSGIVLSWWSVALISVVAELLVFHLEFRRERYTFTLSEVPLVLGLFFAGPAYLIGGRLLGELLFLVVKERQPFRKVVVNLASFLTECTVLLVVYELIGVEGTVRRPLVWIACLAAVASADVVGYLIVATVVRWHGAPVDLHSIFAAGLLTAPVNTSFALTIGILMTVVPWATLLLSGIAVFLFLSYRSYAALSQRHSSLLLLYDFTRLVSGSKSPDAVLEAILTQSKDLVRADRAEIWLADGDHYVGLRVNDDGFTSVALTAQTSMLVADWLSMPADGTALLVPTEGKNARQQAIAEAFGATECIVAPITEGRSVVGVIAVVDRLGEIATFEAQDVRLFATLANHASVALENGRLIDRLHDEATQREHEAHHDALTGLPNRVLFGTRLRARLAEIGVSSGTLAIAVMDLDGFKEINDTLGHQWGDEVLCEVARRLNRVVRAPATVARLGGDEFALLIPHVEAAEDVETLARRVRAAVAEPLTISDLRLEVGISIGLALSPDDGADATTLLQRADIAMYSGKAGMGDGVNRYRSEDDQNTPRRLAMANDLREAITREEVTLVYQPKGRLGDGNIVGFEALARWRHPVLGVVFPDEFIPLAERTGIITSLTAFVLRTALRQVKVWQQEGHDWGVSVNLSMRNLLDNDLAESVGRMLEEIELDPSRVTLEITETNVMSDAARSIGVLHELSSLGVKLSIDDFGTGYSSLAYLQKLPVDEVKIDKSFVMPMVGDANVESLVRSIVDLGHNLGLQVVAEGVEDQVTLDRLRTLGCDVVQGYFLGRPMPAADLQHWYYEHLSKGRPSANGRLSA